MPPGAGGWLRMGAVSPPGAAVVGLLSGIAAVYCPAMKKFALFVLVAVLVAWVAKKVREV